MRAVSIFVGIALSGIIRAQDTTAQNAFSTHLVGRHAEDGRIDYDMIARGHSFRHSIVPKSVAQKPHGDSAQLLRRHAEAHLMSGLKKMVSNGLKTHGAKITKVAHGMLQDQLKKFIPVGLKEKGEGKDKGKEKGKDKTGGKDEKKSKKDKGSVTSRDLMGGMQGAMYDTDLRSGKVNYLDTMMTVLEMAERGAALINPDRPPWDYD